MFVWGILVRVTFSHMIEPVSRLLLCFTLLVWGEETIFSKPEDQDAVTAKKLATATEELLTFQFK